MQTGWLGDQDSNLGSRDRNPLPYRLATPQRGMQAGKIMGNHPADNPHPGRRGGPAARCAGVVIA